MVSNIRAEVNGRSDERLGNNSRGGGRSLHVEIVFLYNLSIVMCSHLR
jgi:hypothetical protein